MIDEQQLTRITRLIEEANRIYLYGKGSSAQALKEMKTRFMRLGFDFDIVTDNDELIWSSMLVGPDCGLYFLASIWLLILHQFLLRYKPTSATVIPSTPADPLLAQTLVKAVIIFSLDKI